ncbi:MAG: PD40 domain-containing protein [Flavobacteriales bacterium]|nr:PD40 domain-containing protein [Flavobacteriales bacterium]MCB9168645.1 PD40 domain-containing protein [Flavobacteriales bacterium]
MRYSYPALLALALLSTRSATAQGDNTSFNWKFEEANKLMEEKFYNQAAEIWKELLDQQPDNANLQYKLGYSYFHSYNHKQKALSYLEAAAQKRKGGYGGFNTSGYDPFDPKETNAPVEVDYYLGRAYHLNGEFDKADQFYQKFIDEVDQNHELRQLAIRGKEQTANARTLIADPKAYEISNVGPVVNSEYPDFSPVLSVDGNALFFTSRRIRPDSSNAGIIDEKAGLPFENIYVSYKDREGNWQAPELLNINPADAGHLASVNVSADGQTLIIYRDDGGDGNLYESKLVGELWSDPVLIGSDVNTKSWETHAALSADGNTLYFVSDRKGGSGGRDIYRVVRLPDGEWSKAQNIGNVVNTPYDEDGVFIHPNGRTLFFASKGHNSMGGFDIFSTELQDDGTWTPPVNIGYPLNTVDDDVFFVTTADGRRGYFSSDKIGGYGEKDIYFVDFPEEMEAEGLTVLKGFIVPPPGQSIPPSTILYVTDKSTGEVKTYKPRQRDGVYVVILPPCKEYNLDYRVDDKTIHTEDIFVECESAYQEINKEIYLNPVAITGPASMVDLPKGSPPGSKEKGVPTTGKETAEEKGKASGKEAMTDKEMKDKGVTHTMPDASYVKEYQKFYAYNMKDIDLNESDWKAFIDAVVNLIDEKGKANVVIESSASHVPTKTYGSNENLSNLRMEDARKRLIESVQARGKDPNKILLEAVNHLVQGPRYRGDYKETEKYGKFQYVKLKTR